MKPPATARVVWPEINPTNRYQPIMKNSLKFLVTLAGLALLAAPALRAAEPTPPPADKPDRHERREDMRENAKKMAKELDLTADQQAKIEAIHKQSRDAMRALHDDTTLSEEQKREKSKALRKSSEEQVHALLSPEQQTKAKELRGNRGERGERGGGKPGGDKPRRN